MKWSPHEEWKFGQVQEFMDDVIFDDDFTYDEYRFWREFLEGMINGGTPGETYE